MTTEKIKILLVDDHSMVVEGMKAQYWEKIAI